MFISKYLRVLNEKYFLFPENIKKFFGKEIVENSPQIVNKYSESVSDNLYQKEYLKIHIERQTSKIKMANRELALYDVGEKSHTNKLEKIKEYIKELKNYEKRYQDAEKNLEKIKKDSLKEYRDLLAKKALRLKNLKKAGVIVSATILASTIITLSYKFYKKHMTEMGKQCGKLPPYRRRPCEDNFKIRALQNRISILKQNLNKCDKTNNPEKCKGEINKKINQLQRKIENM